MFTNYLPSATFTWDINVYRTVKAKKQEARGKYTFSYLTEFTIYTSARQGQEIGKVFVQKQSKRASTGVG